MKKSIQLLVLLLVATSAFSQQEKGITGFNSWLNNWTEFKPNKVEYDEALRVLTGNISVNTTLTKKDVWLLDGIVYLTNNAVLTIEPGTVIMGNAENKACLVVTKGATIIANGLETDPIVFTSNKPLKKAGDWGGVFLLGDAPINKYGGVSSINLDSDGNLSAFGGTNPVANSGVLKYVRIEYAGAKVRGAANFNALLLAGVGNKTVIDNVMVSYSAGDSFEMLGGEATLSKLVSFKCSNDDFKFNYGAQAKIENSLVIRASYLTNSEGSRCINVVSYDKKEEVDFSKKQTFVSATNLTLVNNSMNVKSDTDSGLIKEGVFVGENASIYFKKTVISGFNPAILLDQNIDVNDQNLKKLKLEQMYFNMCKGNIFVQNNTNNEDLESWYGNPAFGNEYEKLENQETFIDFNNDKRPDFRLRVTGTVFKK